MYDSKQVRDTLSEEAVIVTEGSRQDILICSFYTPGGYYEECAERFSECVHNLGLSLHLEELVVPEGKTWPEICRKKIPYLYRVRQQSRGKKLFWVDVDCQLIDMPDFIGRSSADIIGFQRGFGNPLAIGYANKTRFWEPCFLGFNATEGADRFLECAYELERTLDINATDDYFFEEAWRREAQNLSFQIIPSVLSKPTHERRFFIFGSSSNVQKFKGTVRQHEAPDGLQKKKPAGSHAVKGISHTPLPIRKDSFLRKLAREHLPEPVIRFIIANRERFRALVADKKGESAVSGDSSSISLRNFAILVKKQYVYGESPATASLDELIERVENRQSARAVLEWGAAFKDYRDYSGERSPIDLVWWDTPSPGNFGDWLSPYIITRISGRPVTYRKPGVRLSRPHVVAIGSIIKFAQKGSVVLGTGIANAGTRIDPGARFESVRGPHTADCVRESGGIVPEVFGDLGILMSRIYPKQRTHETMTGVVGLVRHIRHQEMDLKLPSYVEEYSIWSARPGALEALVDFVITKDFVITSAMHCYIVCQSYGISCALVTFKGAEDVVPGDGIKYKDYHGGVGLRERLPDVIPTDLTNIDLQQWVSDDRVPLRLIDDVYDHARRCLENL